MGVFEKHLVEIAEAKKQDGVLVPLLDLEVLLHHRRDLGSVHGVQAEPLRPVSSCRVARLGLLAHRRTV